MADADDILERLDKLGLRLIWTLFGERLAHTIGLCRDVHSARSLDWRGMVL